MGVLNKHLCFCKNKIPAKIQSHQANAEVGRENSEKKIREFIKIVKVVVKLKRDGIFYFS